jgi:hypothetical protein
VISIGYLIMWDGSCRCWLGFLFCQSMLCLVAIECLPTADCWFSSLVSLMCSEDGGGDVTAYLVNTCYDRSMGSCKHPIFESAVVCL